MLEKAIEQLKAYGPADQVTEGVAQLEKLLQKIRVGLWSRRERKNVKYSMESVGRMSSAEMWTGNDQAPSFKGPRRPSHHPSSPSDTHNTPTPPTKGSAH
jgi:hypothetical protein